MNVFEKNPKEYKHSLYQRDFGSYSIEVTENKLNWSIKRPHEKKGKFELKFEYPSAHMNMANRSLYLLTSHPDGGFIAEKVDCSGLASGQPPVKQPNYFEITSQVGNVTFEVAEGNKLLAFIGGLNNGYGVFVVFKEPVSGVRAVQLVDLSKRFHINPDPYSRQPSEVKTVYIPKLTQISLSNFTVNLALNKYVKQNENQIIACSLKIRRGVAEPIILAEASITLDIDDPTGKATNIVAITNHKGQAFYIVVIPSGIYHILRLLPHKLVYVHTSKESILIIAKFGVQISVDRTKKLIAVSEQPNPDRYATVKQCSSQVVVYKLTF